MMVLLIGSNGNMGKRYSAILNYFGVEFVGLDFGEFELTKRSVENKISSFLKKNDFTHIIIATTTSSHLHILEHLILHRNYETSILCEKPISIIENGQDLKVLKNFATYRYVNKIFVVNNWQYIVENHIKNVATTYAYAKHKNCASICSINYDFYHTGKDGLEWDCWQLFGLDAVHLTLKDKSPIWKVEIDDCRVSKDEVDVSYCLMVKDFISGNHKNLWDIDKALKISEKVYDYTKNSNWDTGKKLVQETTP